MAKISTSVEKPLTEGVVPVSDNRTKSEVFVVNDEGKVKLADFTFLGLKKIAIKKIIKWNLNILIFIKKVWLNLKKKGFQVN